MRSFVIVFVMCLTACSGSPGESEGREALLGYLGERAGTTPVEIVTFRKTDGQNFDQMDAEGYRLFFEAQVRFPAGFYTQCLNQDQIPDGMERFRVGMQCSQQFSPFSRDPLRPMPIGGTIDLNGEVSMSKTENGWLSQRVQLDPTASR